jgi:hypothetical protein
MKPDVNKNIFAVKVSGFCDPVFQMRLYKENSHNFNADFFVLLSGNIQFLAIETNGIFEGYSFWN